MQQMPALITKHNPKLSALTEIKNTYIKSLQKHFEDYFGVRGIPHVYGKSKEKVHPDFFVLEFKPNRRHNFWTYCSVGMSIDIQSENLIEMFVFSPREDDSLVELLTICAYYHRKCEPLNLHHTVNFGKPWLEESVCTCGFLSLPYLDGEKLEIFKFNNRTFHCYWLIPITEQEKEYKIENGTEALEQLFEDRNIDYLNPKRKCLLNT